MLRTICAAVIAASTFTVHARDMIAQSGNDWIRLHEKECTNKHIVSLLPDDMKDARAATVRVNGQIYAACWVVVPGGIGLQYEDGDRGGAPFSAFKPAQDV